MSVYYMMVGRDDLEIRQELDKNWDSCPCSNIYDLQNGKGGTPKCPMIWECLSKLLCINLMEHYVVIKNDKYVDRWYLEMGIWKGKHKRTYRIFHIDYNYIKILIVWKYLNGFEECR